LTLLARHVASGEEVRRVLVGADADELRLHSELVEARGGEERRRGETVDRQDRLRSREDPVGRRCDTIVEVPGGFQVKGDLLAGRTQALDSATEFVRSPSAERELALPPHD